VDTCPNNPALGWRPVVNDIAQPYAWLTYAQAYKQVVSIGTALKALGVSPGCSVGLYATNSPEWMMAMKSIDYCGALCVPLYDSFGSEAVRFVVQHSGAKVIFASSEKLPTLCKDLPAMAGQVVQVVVWSSLRASPAAEAVKEVCVYCTVSSPLQ
jgi:long-chain acyl-CoA synthetase